MQLTPEQQEQLQQAKADGQQRVMMRYTKEQREDWRSAMEQELVGKDANIAHIQKIRTAAQQAGLFGDVRRAILLAHRPPTELSAEIGIEPHLLSDFCAGESDLPAAALDRLVEVLGLRLMQEIPH